MGKNYSAKAIKKDTEELDNLNVQIEKRRIKLRCSCNHRYKDGELAIVDGTKKLPNGDTLKIYQCKICKAQIVRLRLDNEASDELFNKMISHLDYFKFATTGNSEKDEERLEKIGKVQYALHELKPVYKKLREAAEKRNKQRDRRNNDGGSSYIRSNY